jgi:hypothetical protein
VAECSGASPEDVSWIWPEPMLISFDDAAMTFPEEELPDLAEAAHTVVQEAKGSGV